MRSDTLRRSSRRPALRYRVGMPTPTAAEIIAKCEAVYATCASYEDEGEEIDVTNKGPDHSDRREDRNRFRTAFVRPDQFFFESRFVPRPNVIEIPAWIDREVVWATSPVAQRWEAGRRYEDYKEGARQSGTLMDMVGFGTPATIVSRMLLPQPKRGLTLPLASSAESLGSDQLDDNTECYRVKGSDHRDSQPFTVWIESATGLLRRKEVRENHDRASQLRFHADLLRALSEPGPDPVAREGARKMLEKRGVKIEPDYSAIRTTTWYPRLNVSIDPRVFAFEPPG